MQTPFLDAGDASTMTDYRATYRVLHRLKFVPMDLRQVALFAIVCALPAIPIVLTEISLETAARTIARALLGSDL